MNWKLAGGAAAVLALVALLAIPPLLPASGGGELSAYDSSPFGLTEARSRLGETYATRNVASSALVLKDIDANSTLLVVAGLNRPYTPSEEEALDGFLRDGGAILLLDDYGFGEDYTRRHGIEFLRRPLLDAAFEQNQSFVRVAAHLEGQAYSLLLNSPSGLRDVDAADPLLKPFIVSSPDSYLDLDQNGRIDVSDKTGPFNVGLRREVGAGTLYVVADSGFAVNDMIHRRDNTRFLQDLAGQEIPPDGLVLFDESKRGIAASEAPALATQRAALAIYRNIPAFGLMVLGSVGLLAVLALLRLPGRESWMHRFTPGLLVPPPQPRTTRELVVSILQAKQALDVGTGIQDPVVESALRDPSAIRDDDIPRLLEHVRSSMDLELPSGESAST